MCLRQVPRFDNGVCKSRSPMPGAAPHHAIGTCGRSGSVASNSRGKAKYTLHCKKKNGLYSPEEVFSLSLSLSPKKRVYVSRFFFSLACHPPLLFLSFSRACSGAVGALPRRSLPVGSTFICTKERRSLNARRECKPPALSMYVELWQTARRWASRTAQPKWTSASKHIFDSLALPLLFFWSRLSRFSRSPRWVQTKPRLESALETAAQVSLQRTSVDRYRV